MYFRVGPTTLATGNGPIIRNRLLHIGFSIFRVFCIYPQEFSLRPIKIGLAWFWNLEFGSALASLGDEPQGVLRVRGALHALNPKP